MDRNVYTLSTNSRPVVALRKESVDRNKWWGFPYIPLAKSLSARRAWIEIQTP